MVSKQSQDEIKAKGKAKGKAKCSAKGKTKSQGDEVKESKSKAVRKRAEVNRFVLCAVFWVCLVVTFSVVDGVAMCSLTVKTTPCLGRPND